MTRKRKGPRRRPGIQGTSDPARLSAVPDVKDLAKALADALSHQTSTTNMADFAGAVVHNALGQGAPVEETTAQDRQENRFKKWNQDHPPRWGAWVATCLIAVAPMFTPSVQAAQSQPPPQSAQSPAGMPFGAEVTITVVSTGPPGPTSASGGGPTPGSRSGAEFVNVNLDLSALAKFMPSQPYTLPQEQIFVIADEIATEIHAQLVQNLPGESVPMRVQVGEFVYDMSSIVGSQPSAQVAAAMRAAGLS